MSIAAVLQSSVMVTIMLCIISSTYGAGFSCLPSLLADKFGMDKISSIHGLALTAWAFAGLSGNQLSTWIHDKTGSYTNVLYVLIILYAIGLLMTYVLIQSDRKQEGTKAA